MPASGMADRPFAQLFLERAVRHANAVAFRHKDLGIWTEATWGEWRRHAEHFALGLLELGAQPGDRIAIMGDAIPEWLYADIAAQSIGLIPFGIYVTSGAADVSYLLEHSGATMFIAEDQEYVDKLFASGYGDITHIIVADNRGMFAYRDERLRSFADIEKLGQQRAQLNPGEWESHIAGRHADEPIAIFYTSGTTGRPKGALLSSRNIITAWTACFVENPAPSNADRTVAALPLAHISERNASVYGPVMYGSVPHIPENQDGEREAMVDVQPTIMIGLPRTWETYASQIQVDIELSSWLKRKAYALAMVARQRYIDDIYADRKPSLLNRLMSELALLCVLRRILDKFGYTELRFTTTGGAPVSPEVLKLWHLWGVQIKEIYGMTEASGYVTLPRGRVPVPGTAGQALPGISVTLDEDGEILIKGDNVFLGYYKNPVATAAALDPEGYLHSGDIGEFQPDGNLKVIDRKKDILRTAAGLVVPSSQIEHKLKFSPYVRDAMLVGDGRDYLSALIELDFDTTAEWARHNGITYTGFTNLASNPRIIQLIDTEVAQANRSLAAAGLPIVEKFRVLNKELDPEASDEITPTRKVKRRDLTRKFAALVAEMYPADPEPSQDAAHETLGATQ